MAQQPKKTHTPLTGLIPMTNLPNGQYGFLNIKNLIILVLLILLIIAVALWYGQYNKNEVETITREGVVTQVQKLNRLQTVTFSVDTVITSQKAGNWYVFWQDEQKGLFIAHGRVNAGVDLSKLSPEMVQVVYPENADTSNHQPIMPKINITIPPSEIFDVYLDNMEVYDWRTGIFGMLQADPEILKQAQIAAKKEVLAKACQGDIMQMALDNAQVQIQKLFELTGASVTVTTQGVGGCHVHTSS